MVKSIPCILVLATTCVSAGSHQCETYSYTPQVPHRVRLELLSGTSDHGQQTVPHDTRNLSDRW